MMKALSLLMMLLLLISACSSEKKPDTNAPKETASLQAKAVLDTAKIS
jgi:PBP1b-binding outer membrane lipoprotein LpoB